MEAAPTRFPVPMTHPAPFPSAGQRRRTRRFSLLVAATFGCAAAVAYQIYNVVCTARFGGTPGKLIVGIKVIHQDGRPIDLRGAFIRFSPVLALIVLGMVPIVNFVVSFARLGLLLANLVLVLVDERRKDVFDRVASTYVVTSR